MRRGIRSRAFTRKALAALTLRDIWDHRGPCGEIAERYFYEGEARLLGHLCAYLPVGPSLVFDMACTSVRWWLALRLGLSFAMLQRCFGWDMTVLGLVHMAAQPEAPGEAVAAARVLEEVPDDSMSSTDSEGGEDGAR